MGIKAGFIGEGSFEIGDKITIGMIQTLSTKEDETKKLREAFGLVIAEECHHIPCESFFNVIGMISPKFLYGLSATVERSDGLEQMIYRIIGQAIATISKAEVEYVGATVPISVISIKTRFNPGFVSSWSEYLNELTYSAERNLIIVELARKEADPVLILCDRIAHLNQLSEMLSRGIYRMLLHTKSLSQKSDQRRCRS